jgi:RHS repeat-associated protein
VLPPSTSGTAYQSPSQTQVSHDNAGQGCACGCTEVRQANQNNNVGNPVNMLTGQFYYPVVDVDIPCPGLPLTVTRMHQTQQLVNSTMPEVWQWNVVGWLDEDAVNANRFKLTYPSGRWAEFTTTDMVHYTPTAAFGDITDTAVRNPNGSLTLIDTQGTQTNYTFFQSNATDNVYLIASKTDRYGNSLTWQYQNGAIVSITSSCGRSLQFNMDPITVTGTSTATDPPHVIVQINSITDNLGRVWTYNGYQGFLGRGYAMDSVTYPGNRTWSYTYSATGLILTVTDPNGHITDNNTYDATNTKVVHQVNSNGDTYDFVYGTDSNGNYLNSVTRGQNGTSQGTATYTFDPTSGDQVSNVDEVGDTTSYTYDPVSARILSQTDGLGHTTSFLWDQYANLLSTTDALGQTWTFQYEPVYNTMTQATSPLNQVWTFKRDALANLIASVDPLTHTTSYSYNQAGQPVSITNAVQETWTMGYNGTGDLVTVADPLADTTTLTVDPVGRTTAVTDPLGHTTTQVLDPGDRVISAQDALGNTTTMAWDQADNLLQVVDALGRTSQMQYNPINQVTQLTDALKGNTKLSYDGRDNLSNVNNANGVNAASYVQDHADQTVQETLVSDTTNVTYDAAHRPVSGVTPRGITITYTYDNDNRLLSRVSSDGTVKVSYTYDALGRRTSMVDLVGTTTYAYDLANRLLSKTQYGKTVAYVYDAASRLTSRTDAAGVATVNKYDKADRLVKAVMGSMSVAFTYDAASRVTTKAFSNGLSCAMTYDNDNRVLSMTWTGGACHADGSNTTYAYGYDAVGNRVSDTETDGRQTRLAWTYTVDALNRLVSASLNGSSITNWSIDAVGNILSEATGPVQRVERWGGCDGFGGTQTDTFAVNAKDQVTAVDGAALTWDADGNLLTKPDPGCPSRAMQFTWDAEDRLIQITFADGSKERNAYDGDGRRVATTDRWGQAASFVWSGGDLLDDYDRQNNPSAMYFLTGSEVQGNTGWGIDARCDIQAFRNQAPTTFYVWDAMANVRQVTDGQCNLANSFDYQPFGQLLTPESSGQGFAGFGFVVGPGANSAEPTNPYRFVGALGVRYDAGSGLYYMRHRWYDPGLGRFLGRDLIKTDNRYDYCNDNPVTQLDPDGLVPPPPDEFPANSVIMNASQMVAGQSVKTPVGPYVISVTVSPAGSLWYVLVKGPNSITKVTLTLWQWQKFTSSWVPRGKFSTASGPGNCHVDWTIWAVANRVNSDDPHLVERKSELPGEWVVQVGVDGRGKEGPVWHSDAPLFVVLIPTPPPPPLPNVSK